jgi:glycine cleavage system H lipoate-binding protein
MDPHRGDTGTIGITDYAQGSSATGRVELPDIGRKVEKGGHGRGQSVKAASEVMRRCRFGDGHQ